MIIKRKKRRCYNCKNFLKKGDPTRKIKLVDGSTSVHYTGLCYQCQADRNIILNWKKKGITAIDEQHKKLSRLFWLIRIARQELSVEETLPKRSIKK
jgi:hypothetical protein